MTAAQIGIEIPEMVGRTAGALFEGLRESTLEGDPNTPVTTVTFDSREVRAGSMFVAIKGGYADGHAYLNQAHRAGATTALVDASTPSAELDGYLAVLRAIDTRAALAQVATRYFDIPSRAMRVVGVTGTDGKTTTSHMIEAVCRASDMRMGLVGTVAVRIGDRAELHESRQTTPESLLIQGYLAAMRADGVEVALIEATSHGLALHRLDGCLFDVGVITNITHEHLDFHGSIDAYRLAKGSLLSRVVASRESGKLGVVVVNTDDEGSTAILPLSAGAEIISFSLNPDRQVDITARGIRPGSAGSRFELVTRYGTAEVALQMPGRYNVANALAAAGACLALGLSVRQIANGLSLLTHVPGRMESVNLGQPYSIIVDYAHTPEALAALLRELRPATEGRLMVIFGSAGERDVSKRAIQGRIGVELADYAIFTSEDPRFEDPHAIIEQIAAGAIEGGRTRGVHFDCIEDRALAIRTIVDRARPGDTIVLAGKGHEHSMIYGAEKRPWDEAAIARMALYDLGYRDNIDPRQVTHHDA